MEIDQDILEEIIKRMNPERDWLDIISDLSVPILSITALVITTVISFKQWYLMKYEYKLKLYPERYELYKYLTEILIEFQQVDEIIGNKHKFSILKIENKMFLYSKDVNSKYQEFKSWINSIDATTPDFDKQQYINEFKCKLSTLIDLMKQYLSKFYIEIA